MTEVNINKYKLPQDQLSLFKKLIWIGNWWILTLAIVMPEIVYGENSLQDISFTALPGNKVELRIIFAETPATPNTFTVESPPRLVLDFFNTKLSLPNKTVMIGVGSVRSVTAVEADNRTRLVFYFDRKITYDLKQKANTILLSMDNGLNVATQNTRLETPATQVEPATSSTTQSAVESPDLTTENAPIVKDSSSLLPPATDSMQTPLPPASNVVNNSIQTKDQIADTSSIQANESELKVATEDVEDDIETAIESEAGIPVPISKSDLKRRQRRPDLLNETVLTAKTQHSLSAVDFNRGSNGEGKVLITLNSPSIAINLLEEGSNVIVEIFNASLPKSLHQKLDVIDFATPVQTIVTEPKGDHIRISVTATGGYEYVAYQVDKLYTLEFYPLTPDQQEQLKKQRKVYTGERLTLNFQDIPVRSLLNLLGDFADRNVVISDAVKGNVTLRLKNVPWDQAMDIILKTKFLGKRENDSVIYIAPSADLISQEQTELEADRKVEELAPLQLELIEINYAEAGCIAAVILGKSCGGTGGKGGNTNKNTDDNTNSSNDNTNKSSANVINTASINPTANSDGSFLSARGSVNVYKPTNTLIIQDTTERLEAIRSIIAKLDVPPQQVLIEARIVIADNSFSKELGVRFGWSGAREIGDGNAVNIGGGLEGYIEGTGTMNHGTWLSDINGNPFAAGFAQGDTENLMVNMPVSGAAVDFLIGKIGSYLLQLELSAMQVEGKGEVVSSPRVLASNNEEAIITQGALIPYTIVGSDGEGTKTTHVEFKPIELSLTVTPHITPDNKIILELQVEKETPVYFGDSIGAETRNVETKVLVDDGETVSLGGVYEQNRGSSKDSVPVFGDIPVFGNLFKRTKRSDSQKELLIFVTPKIVRPEAIRAAK